MKVIDADSHFFEPLGWFETEFPALAARMPPFNLLDMISGSVLPSDDFVPSLPERFRPDPLSVVPAILKPLLSKLSDKGLTVLECKHALFESGDPDAEFLASLWRGEGIDPSERVQFLDKQGIDFALMNPSAPAFTVFHRAVATGDEQLQRECLYAWNTWAANSLSHHTDRLSAVAQIDLRDVPGAITELRRMRKLGTVAFNPRCEPINGKSLAHPDFARVWAEAEALGMVVMFHVGTGRPHVAPGWVNDGTGNVLNYLNLLKTQEHQAPALALAALILGGVLERHPNLAFLVAELGVSWLPHWLEVMDSMSFTLSAELSPTGTTTLPGQPSEYVARQVFVAPLPHQKLNPVLSLAPGVLQFATDYPHPEGSPNAKSVFDAQLASASASVRSDFYGGRLAPFIGLH